MNIIQSILEGLSTYYGLDYLSFILGAIGIIFLTSKKSSGFLFSAISVILAAITAIIAKQYGFLLANSLNVFLLIRGYYIWKKENKENLNKISKTTT